MLPPNQSTDANVLHDGIYRGELYAINLLPNAQRRGLGRRLVQNVASALLQSSLGSMQLWVLASNAGARHFYEALQGRPAGERFIQLVGTNLGECAKILPLTLPRQPALLNRSGPGVIAVAPSRAAVLSAPYTQVRQ
jgi:hypothetical protein